MEPMVTDDEREAFSRRLNGLLDTLGVPAKGRGRQGLVGTMFGVSQKGARKWLEGEAMPSTTRLPEIARRLHTTTEYLLTGNPPGPDPAIGEVMEEAGEYASGPAGDEAFRAVVQALASLYRRDPLEGRRVAEALQVLLTRSI